MALQLSDKLRILADAARYDASCASGGVKRGRLPGGVGDASGSGICHSYAPDGRCISLLKILLSNVCIYDCSYCVNRVSNDVRRAKFTIDEVVRLTLDFYRRNCIEGLFLSSGVFRSSDRTMEEMVEVARRLREAHRFGGYIHLKAVAGCSAALVRAAGRYADRVSANIELPRAADMVALAPGKTHQEAEAVMGVLREGIEAAAGEASQARPAGPQPPRFAPGGQSTQMVVGASPSPDQDVLGKADELYRRHRLRRVYYSAFTPIAGAPAGLPRTPPPLMREHRLYQADWLLRFYGFRVGELVFARDRNLDLGLDPKLAWALAHRELFPLDVNRASREQLLRVPGLGVGSVERILTARRHGRLWWSDLLQMRLPLARVRHFLVAHDRAAAPSRLDSADLGRLLTPPTQLPLALAPRPPAATAAGAVAVAGDAAASRVQAR